MVEPLRLLCVLAHPDDETLGCGGVIAKYAVEGVEVYLITATRGERGWTGDPKDDPGLAVLGRIREAELRCAAETLGIREVHVLDYIDGELAEADSVQATAKIVALVRRIKPHVVTTFDSFGAYGHPDHIAISQFTQAALMCAADPSYTDPDRQLAHRVSKLYFQADSIHFVKALEQLVGPIEMPVDGEIRTSIPWPEWAITTRIDAEAHWPIVKRAAECHRSQMSAYPPLDSFSVETHQLLWGHPTLYRVYSTVNGGRAIEHDVFEGLR